MVLYALSGRAALGPDHQFTGWRKRRSTPFTSERLVIGTLPTDVTCLANGGFGRLTVRHILGLSGWWRTLSTASLQPY